MLRRNILVLAVALAMTTVTFVPSAGAQDATLVVDDDNTECPDAGYSSIQSAVDDASTGDTVEVCRGTYDGPIVVEKAIGLVATGPGDVTITNTEGPSSLPDGGLVVLATSPTELPGLTFDGFIVEGTPDLTTDAFRVALIRTWASGAADAPVTISNNVVQPGGHDNVAGIVTNGGPGHVDITGNTIVGNNPAADDAGTSFGIWLNGGHNTNIADNAIDRVTFSAIGLGEGGDNHPFQSPKPAQITIEGNSFVDIAENEDFAGGSSLWDAVFHVQNGAHDLSIQDNDIRRVNGAVMKLHDRGDTDLSNVALNHNEFTNTNSGVHNPFGPTIDATENWWGTPLGPDDDDNTGNVDDSDPCLTPTCTIQKAT